eukprot:CAMPEP_0177789456 /NCGR_PEP_ID=MMETSP0491_2-20121128/22764_1 /TAXON_ID=63592 /ORGANISM="Tetraselmis chuii, Strain PLY429" /LENGTH=94 /DNA_ID=CAMNT_0019311331 /DNA_START=524 /DNA_END=805 /DNA_ORIENTATION=+
MSRPGICSVTIYMCPSSSNELAQAQAADFPLGRREAEIVGEALDRELHSGGPVYDATDDGKRPRPQDVTKVKAELVEGVGESRASRAEQLSPIG